MNSTVFAKIWMEILKTACQGPRDAFLSRNESTVCKNARANFLNVSEPQIQIFEAE